MPCPSCNQSDPPRMPPGFKIDVDEEGSPQP
jgi:hypothetical protein